MPMPIYWDGLNV
jgi:hypothetical protein